MPIRLWNTLTHTRQFFRPQQPGVVTLYTCGPTVYNYMHIGNARTFVFEDLLKRTLIASGMHVKHIMNITDVGHLTNDSDDGEDKMERAALTSGKDIWELAAFYTKAFLQDSTALHILPPQRYTKATEHIKEQIALIKKLERTGHTYQTHDGIYFDTSTWKKYGVLMSKKHLNGLRKGARVKTTTEKRSATDFALWKFSPTSGAMRQMEWESPWGVGFPGWHIECSAMAMKYLGETLDIHCGGVDHITIHHTNEIAQSEAATGKPFARFWMHGEFLQINHAKMAKSEGNFLRLSDIRDHGFDPLVYRYFLLQTHYRKQLQFSWKALEAAATGLHHLSERLAKAPAGIKSDSKLLTAITRAMQDDINAPGALALLWKAVGKKGEVSARTAQAVFAADEAFFALGLRERAAACAQKTASPHSIPDIIQNILDARATARANRDFTTSDHLRDQLLTLGYQVIDTSNGQEIQKI
jgi:cysteinyl-tRNA synthetase